LSSKVKMADAPKPAKPAPMAAPMAEAKAAEKPAGDGILYIDATGHIAGRLCSKVASEILRGRRVVVLNAEMAVLSGKRATVIEEWKQKLELGSKVNPIYGPLHPRRPDNIMWRMVRGMVPKTKPSGKTAMSRLRVYMGVPEKYVGVKTRKFDDAMARRPIPQYVTIAQISKNIGWND